MSTVYRGYTIYGAAELPQSPDADLLPPGLDYMPFTAIWRDHPVAPSIIQTTLLSAAKEAIDEAIDGVPGPEVAA